MPRDAGPRHRPRSFRHGRTVPFPAVQQGHQHARRIGRPLRARGHLAPATVLLCVGVVALTVLGYVIASIHEKRDAFRTLLNTAPDRRVKRNAIRRSTRK